MTKEEAKQKIFTLLCEEYQRPGSDGWVHRDRIFKELAIEEKIFSAALMEMIGKNNLNVEIERADKSSQVGRSAASGRIRLGVSGREQCDDRRNALRKK